MAKDLLKAALVAIALIFSNNIYAQIWQETTIADVRVASERMIQPNNYRLFALDDDKIKEELWKAPMESSNNRSSNTVIQVPLRDGSIDDFQIVEYSMMEEGLAKKFPDFKTFYGLSKNNPHRSIRIDYTVNGFRAVIADQNGKVYIDPFQKGDSNHRIIYQKKDLTPGATWSCETHADIIDIEDAAEERFAGDCMLRTYRLACAASGEYTTFHGGTVAAGQAAIVTAINRVNQIYEMDLAARLVLVANNNTIVYTNANTDPYTNSSAGASITQNQTNLDTEIGSANYDVGHVFTTGAGGLASLGSICINGSKARGVTGTNAPINDPFWIDYVAHEIGHQFGGPHTFNGTEGNCSGANRSDANAYEPGSGTTIMAYAGICGSQNVQNNSDAYFHAKSIERMQAVMLSTSCPAVSDFGNTPPVIGSVVDYNVPASTPLVLEVTATDVDGDALTYCWEQIDNEVGFPIPIQSTNTGGAMFRSLFYSSNPKRYLPSIDNVIDGSSDPWEVLPSVTRTMDFRLTVRDHSLVPGCTSEADVEISVDGNSGPFVVNNASIPASIVATSNITLQWDVAGTDGAPINCANVEILLSTDGGINYPYTILASTPNDGSQNITIPNQVTSEARIMVKGEGNIFFDINDSDFEISEPTSPTFSFSLDPSTASECNDGDVQFTINTVSIGGFSDMITFSLNNLPSGASSSFSTNPVSPGSPTTVTLSNLSGAMGNFTIEINGVAGVENQTEDYNLELIPQVTVPSLISPSSGATGIVSKPTFSWGSVNGAESYELRVSSEPNGGGTVETYSTNNTSYSLTSDLLPETTYYWAVRAINACNTSAYSSERNFTTIDGPTCVTLSATGLPKFIPSNATITSIIDFQQSGTITDVNVLNIQGTHSFTGDLSFTLMSPENTTVLLINEECGGNDNFNISIDSDADPGNIDCPMTDGLTFQSEESLSAFNSEVTNGTWTLSITDDFDGDEGTLTNWELQICYENNCDLDISDNAATGTGTLLEAIGCATESSEINLMSDIPGKVIDLGALAMAIDKNLTIKANPADNIIVRYTGSSTALTVQSGKSLTLEGFTLECTEAGIESIRNLGNINMVDMNITNTGN